MLMKRAGLLSPGSLPNVSAFHPEAPPGYSSCHTAWSCDGRPQCLPRSISNPPAGAISPAAPACALRSMSRRATCHRHIPEYYVRSAAVKAKPAIFFGGLGEPLAHPNILDMVRQARQHASQLELITNGMLLSEAIVRELIASGLDVLWVSIDGAQSESYADVRLGRRCSR